MLKGDFGTTKRTEEKVSDFNQFWFPPFKISSMIFPFQIWYDKIAFVLDFALQVFGCCGALFILATNISALKIVISSMKTNLLNLLMALDCFVGMCIAPLLFVKSSEVLLPSSSPEICILVVFGFYFLAMMNGVLPVGIVTHRLIYVCCPTRVMTTEQKKRLNFIILALMLGISFAITASALYYKEHYDKYQICLGKITLGPPWDLPSLHPLPLCTIAVMILRTVSVPIGYALIFFFRRKTDRKAPGLSETSRKRRMARNAVNAKFNFYIWMSEISSYLVLIFGGTFSRRLYMVLSFGVSPILYLLGMEETRVELKKIGDKIF